MPGSSVGRCYLCRALAFHWVEHPADGGWADLLADGTFDTFDRWFPDEDPPGRVRIPICWHCYQSASNEAVGWRQPPEVLQSDNQSGAWRAPFTNHERQDEDGNRNRPHVPRGTRPATYRRT